jgi:hypothetical protein
MKLKKPLIDGRKIMALWNLDNSRVELRQWIGILKNAAWEAELEGRLTPDNVETLPDDKLKAIIIVSLDADQRKKYEQTFNT